MSPAIIFWILVLVVVIYGVVIYNALVQIKHNVSKAWSNIDVLLKQRHDELPKLVEACKQYKQFEQETLQKVTEARARVQSASQAQDIPALNIAEGALRAGLGQIFAVVEAYPELRANEQFNQLMARITSLEEGIADRGGSSTTRASTSTTCASSSSRTTWWPVCSTFPPGIC